MEKIKKILRSLVSWVKKNPQEAFFLGVILLVAAVLRLYKISDYMTFLGDEGRDAIIVRRLLVDADLILIGPGTSIGNMYLGPLYYYMIAIPLLLANFSPVGPAVFIALLGVATVFGVYYVGREWFGKYAGLTASFLYSLSSVVIIYSRSSWNPNIMPAFALLVVYSLWRIWQKREWKWLILLGTSFAFMLQSHYLGLLLAPTIGLFWIITFFEIRKTKLEIKNFVKYSLMGLGIFIFLMSPLVIFDARHGWNNFSSIKKFFAERQETVSARPWNALPKFIPLSEKITTRLVTGKDEGAGVNATLIISLGVFWLTFFALKKRGQEVNKKALLLIFSWLGFALLGLGLYKQEIYDHYFGFFFAAPFLLVGAVLGYINSKGSIGKIISIVALLVLIELGIKDNPLIYPPNHQLARTREVAGKIRDEVGEDKFNLAVIAERNYEDAYQYFLEAWDTKVSDLDPQNYDETVGKYLFVVCELPKAKCDPTHNPKAQVANFGWSKIEAEWEVGGVILYKLAHVQ